MDRAKQEFTQKSLMDIFDRTRALVHYANLPKWKALYKRILMWEQPVVSFLCFVSYIGLVCFLPITLVPALIPLVLLLWLLYAITKPRKLQQSEDLDSLLVERIEVSSSSSSSSASTSVSHRSDIPTKRNLLQKARHLRSKLHSYQVGVDQRLVLIEKCLGLFQW